MPIALTIDALAKILNAEVVAEIAAGDDALTKLSQPGSLVDVADESAELGPELRAYLDTIPPTLLESMRAAIVVAIGANKAVHIQYSPAYDFNVQLWDYGSGLSIHVSGPYPPDDPRKAYVESTGS